MEKKARQKKYLLPVVLLLATLGSCTVYTIPVDSFKTQIEAAKPTERKIDNLPVPTNGIATLQTLDSRQRPVEITVTPNTLIRMTDATGKRVVFYFSSLMPEEGFITGYTSLYLNKKRSIPLGNIRKIEVDNSRKGSGYQP